MAKKTINFDMSHQTVTNQYNAESIHIGVVQNPSDIITALEKLESQLTTALTAGVLPKEKAELAKEEMKEAIQSSKTNSIDKGQVLEHLNKLKEIIGGITALAGLAGGITTLIDAIRAFVH